MGWVWTVVFSVIFGVIAGLVETYYRDEPIPLLHIISVGVVASLVGGVLSKAVAGRLILWVPLALTVLVLIIDRRATDAARGL
jgi:uncharacterized membrane protein YeaQ/YmgE (transglycosylase-associated protein family)